MIIKLIIIIVPNMLRSVGELCIIILCNVMYVRRFVLCVSEIFVKHAGAVI